MSVSVRKKCSGCGKKFRSNKPFKMCKKCRHKSREHKQKLKEAGRCRVGSCTKPLYRYKADKVSSFCEEHYSEDRARCLFKEYLIKKQALALCSCGDINGEPFCLVCGCHDIDVLELDHILNDGYEDREKAKKNGKRQNPYLRLVQGTDSPLKFQTVCANCNRSKMVNGGVFGCIDRKFLGIK